MDKKKKYWLIGLIALGVALVLAIILCAALAPNAYLAAGAKESKIKSKMINIIVPLVIALLIDIAAVLAIIFYKKQEKNKYFTSKNITRLAVFTAVSYILYMFAKFKMPGIFPDFLDMQISDMPALLAGFMMGPLSGCLVIVLKVLLKLPFSITSCVGELGDLILGIAFVLPAALIYKFMRTKKGALISLAIGSVSCVLVALIINRFMLVPFYVYLFDGWGAILGMSKLYKNVTAENFYNYYLWIGVLPFNIIRCFASALVTFLVYKATEKAFYRMFGDVQPQKTRTALQREESKQSNNG